MVISWINVITVSHMALSCYVILLVCHCILHCPLRLLRFLPLCQWLIHCCSLSWLLFRILHTSPGWVCILADTCFNQCHIFLVRHFIYNCSPRVSCKPSILFVTNLFWWHGRRQAVVLCRSQELVALGHNWVVPPIGARLYIIPLATFGHITSWCNTS